MSNFYSVFDEGYFTEVDYELHDDSDVVDDGSTQRGNSSCTFTTCSRRHFDDFYCYLRSNGFNMMKSSEMFSFKVDVFGLTKFEADMLTELFLDNRFVPKNGSGQAA